MGKYKRYWKNGEREFWGGGEWNDGMMEYWNVGGWGRILEEWSFGELADGVLERWSIGILGCLAVFGLIFSIDTLGPNQNSFFSFHLLPLIRMITGEKSDEYENFRTVSSPIVEGADI